MPITAPNTVPKIIATTLSTRTALGTTSLFGGEDGSVVRDLLRQTSQFAVIRSSLGTWTLRQEQVSADPVPAALLLMASALGVFGIARRRMNANSI